MIYITIFLDGKLYGSRLWPAVPRVGDSIGLSGKPDPFIANVKRVVWLNVKQHDECHVDLYCEKAV